MANNRASLIEFYPHTKFLGLQILTINFAVNYLRILTIKIIFKD